MVRLATEGWFLGLATGPYCLGACAPFLIPYMFAEGHSGWRGNIRIICEFMAGRFVAYVLFGALVGWFGGLLRPHVTAWMTNAALGLTAAVMLIYALNRSLPHWRVCGEFLRKRWPRKIPFVLGMLIGINVCPPFLVAVARLIEVGQVGSSIVFFIAFFLGTSLYTLPLLGLSPFTKVERLQFVGTTSALLIGGWFLFRAVIGGW